MTYCQPDLTYADARNADEDVREGGAQYPCVGDLLEVGCRQGFSLCGQMLGVDYHRSVGWIQSDMLSS
jgi:hypothetical protein